jgi:hypothetical protein
LDFNVTTQQDFLSIAATMPSKSKKRKFLEMLEIAAAFELLEDDNNVDDRLMSLLMQENFTSNDLIDLFLFGSSADNRWTGFLLKGDFSIDSLEDFILQEDKPNDVLTDLILGGKGTAIERFILNNSTEWPSLVELCAYVEGRCRLEWEACAIGGRKVVFGRCCRVPSLFIMSQGLAPRHMSCVGLLAKDGIDFGKARASLVELGLDRSSGLLHATFDCITPGDSASVFVQYVLDLVFYLLTNQRLSGWMRQRRACLLPAHRSLT